MIANVVIFIVTTLFLTALAGVMYAEYLGKQLEHKKKSIEVNLEYIDKLVARGVKPENFYFKAEEE